MIIKKLILSSKDKIYRFVESHDGTTYMLIPGELMVKVSESYKNGDKILGYKTLIPYYHHALSRNQIRRMFKNSKQEGRIGGWYFDTRQMKTKTLTIGCQRFMGNNVDGLLRWAGFNV